jgi:hypothetical protein
MKRIFCIVSISLTVIFSFGFRGCDEAFCIFTYRLTGLAYGNNLYIATEENKIRTITLDACENTLEYNSIWSLAHIKSYSLGLQDNDGLYYFCSVGDSGEVVWSPDGGTSWEERGIPGLTKNLFGLDFLNLGSSGIGTVVCGQEGTMYVSTNSGSGWVWTEVNTITTENLNSVIAVDKSLFIVVGDGGTILKTYDQGSTWEDHTVGGSKFNIIFDGGNVQAYGKLWIAGDNGRIYVTTDFGNNWYLQNSGVTVNFHDIKFRNEDEGIVVGDSGVVRYTNNGGTTWQADPYFDGLTDGDIISVATVDFNTGLALVRNTTLDGGSSTSMFMVSSEPLAIDDNLNKIPSEFSLKQNYPNPFNPSTRIKFEIPSTSLVTLKVYDLLGNEITTLVDEEKTAGVYEVEFSATGGSASGGNAYNLSSGIYFYKLQAEGFTQTKKFIFLK